MLGALSCRHCPPPPLTARARPAGQRTPSRRSARAQIGQVAPASAGLWRRPASDGYCLWRPTASCGMQPRPVPPCRALRRRSGWRWQQSETGWPLRARGCSAPAGRRPARSRRRRNFFVCVLSILFSVVQHLQGDVGNAALHCHKEHMRLCACGLGSRARGRDRSRASPGTARAGRQAREAGRCLGGGRGGLSPAASGRAVPAGPSTRGPGRCRHTRPRSPPPADPAQQQQRTHPRQRRRRQQ